LRDVILVGFSITDVGFSITEVKCSKSWVGHF